jgi:hypothetical protein
MNPGGDHMLSGKLHISAVVKDSNLIVSQHFFARPIAV